MSTRVPPDDPTREAYEERRSEILEAAKEAMKDRQTALFERSAREALAEHWERLVPAKVVPEQSSISGWVTTALQSVTLAAIIGCSFWLGSLNTTVSNTAQKLDKLNDGIVGVSKDSLSNRLIAIETKLDSLDKRLENTPQRNK